MTDATRTELREQYVAYSLGNIFSSAPYDVLIVCGMLSWALRLTEGVAEPGEVRVVRTAASGPVL